MLLAFADKAEGPASHASSNASIQARLAQAHQVFRVGFRAQGLGFRASSGLSHFNFLALLVLPTQA